MREASGGCGVDVVYDSVGRATIEGSIRALARRGTLVNFGAASGAVESIEPLALAEAGSLFFTRPHMADYMRDAEEVAWRARTMFEHHAAGRVAATIDRILTLDAAPEAPPNPRGARDAGQAAVEDRLNRAAAGRART